MEYKFMRDGVEEIVPIERWAWGVINKDGTELKQFGDKGDFFQFSEIDWTLAETFVMYKPDEMNKRIDIPLHQGIKVFHFYRNLVLESGTIKIRVYVFGWQDVTDDKKVFNFILPDDRIITSDKDVSGLSTKI